MTQGLVYALVQKYAHSTAGEQRLFSFLKSLQSGGTVDRWEAFQEPLKAVTGFQIVE